MRFLVHSEDATFDAATGKYFFNLDRRIADPLRIRITQAAYTAATQATYPQVVYLRSSKLNQVIRKKHSVHLVDEAHENATDVLCALLETHTIGRYNLQAKNPTYHVQSHIPLRKIDFYFTNNNTILPGEPVAGGGGANSAVTDSDIAAIPLLKMWMDMAPGNLLDSAYANAENFGDPVRYIYQNQNSEVNTFTGLGDFDLVEWGSNGARGLSSQVSWQFANEFAGSNWLGQEDFAIVFGFRAPVSALSGTSRIFDFWWIDVYTEQGVFAIKDVNGTRNSTGLTVIPGKDYIVTIRRADDDGDGTYQFYSRAERLDTSVVSTGTPLPIGKPVSQQQAYYLSKANEHFLDKSGILSYFLFFLGGLDGVNVANAESWIRSKYTGGDTSGQAAPSTDTAATFFLELEID